jgi:excisionase family DNA binding protein
MPAVIHDDVEPLMTIEGVCRRLRATKPTVRQAMQKRGLRFMRVGNRLRFKPEWVEDYIEKSGTAADPMRRARKRR